MTLKKAAVLGANGQLGQNLKVFAEKNTTQVSWKFYNSADLDITDTQSLESLFFKENLPDYLINCAAYTAVDQAEKEEEKARKINAHAVGELAGLCEKHAVTLILISTDFVFDGKLSRPLKEDDPANPINKYGQTKLEGEQEVLKNSEKHFILRTGWLYSNYGHNFLKSMLRLSQEREQLRIVYDQVGTPTHCSVLVRLIHTIIQSDSNAYGIYHIANEGVASWYDFAYEIIKNSDRNCQVLPILSKEYPTPASRPHYSVLDKSKVKKEFGLQLPHWKESLYECLNSL